MSLSMKSPVDLGLKSFLLKKSPQNQLMFLQNPHASQFKRVLSDPKLFLQSGNVWNNYTKDWMYYIMPMAYIFRPLSLSLEALAPTQ